MRILVTGAMGQLGKDVLFELRNRHYEAIGTDIIAGENCVCMDITDGEAVKRTIEGIKPDAVVHCAAWTAVDAAEDEDKRDKVFLINETGTANIAAACSAMDIKMLYLSTDYVFGGTGEKPWCPQDPTDPINVYGMSKLAGENRIRETLEKYFILRISWLFGPNGKNFVATMLNVGRNHDTVRVVNDQIGTPTYTRDLAVLIADMIATDKYGLYLVSNEGGYISWYEFCCEIYRKAGLTTKVLPVTTQEYGHSKARRPANSRMNKSALAENGFCLLPDWRDALGRYLDEVGL